MGASMFKFRWLGLIFVLLLSGCKIAVNADELMEQIDKCEGIFQSECTLIAVPNSGEQDMRGMYIKWMDYD